MKGSPDPERELVRRLAPWGLPATGLALLGGALAGGAGPAWSAGLGVAVVATNFALHGLSLSWAAGVSITALATVAMAGFVLRMGAIVALLFVLDRFAWFSPLAFGLAVVPATLVLLGLEVRLVSRGVGSELRLPPTAVGERVGR
ncbi:MAG TPA: hypothetical protein VNO34_06090 [Actinomycetota bacterium]|nr:hypothetical protein [Actinomycetota bacterium]